MPAPTPLRTMRALLLLAIAGPLAAADWDRFRGPGGLGIANGQDIPTTFSSDDCLWKTPLPGKGNSSPIVSRGKVFLQAASDDSTKRMMLCVDAKSGKIDWSKELPGGFAKTHDKNSLASGTPTADGERVYTVFWDGKSLTLTAWTYEGSSVWTKPLGGFISQHGPGMSPIVHDGRLFLNLDQDDKADVAAFDCKTGKELWRKKRPAFRASYTTPFVLDRDGKPEIVVGSTAGVTAYAPADGKELWTWTWDWTPDANAPKAKKAKGGPLRNVGGPIFHQGLIFAISGDGGGDREMVALKAGTSGVVKGHVWKKTRETPYVPMPLAHGDHLYWIDDKLNTGICVEAKTGKIVYNERLGGSSQVSACPVLIDGNVFTVNESGKVHVFKASPTFDLVAENDLKEAVYASPAVADGRLFIRGSTHLFCIGKK